MIRALPHISIVGVLFALHLSILAVAHMGGFVSDRMVELWAAGLIEVGSTAFRQTASFYPPLPDGLNLVATWLLPDAVAPPVVLSAALAAALSAQWFANLRQRGGYDRITAALLAAFLALNPVFLRAAAEGPGMVLLLFGTWLYLRGLVNLRIRGSAPDIMKIGLGLVIATLSHAYGLVIAAAALPCLMLAGRPDQISHAPMGFLATMAFPIVLSGLSLVFVSLVFGLPIFTPQPGSGMVRMPGAALPTIAALLPATLAAIAMQARHVRIWLPLSAGAATLGLAMAMNLWLGAVVDPILIAAPCLCLQAVAVRFWPPSGRRSPVVMAVLALSLATSAALILRPGPVGAQAWVAATLGQGEPSPVTQDARAIATYLDGRPGALIDIERSPEVAVALGSVRDLAIAGRTEYDLALRTRRAMAAHVVLRASDGGTGPERDRLARALDVSGSGIPFGYELAFAAGEWRVYGRLPP